MVLHVGWLCAALQGAHPPTQAVYPGDPLYRDLQVALQEPVQIWLIRPGKLCAEFSVLGMS